MKRQLRFAVGIGVILIAIAYFAFAGYQEGKAYYSTIDELSSMGPGADGRRLRVAGIVQPGSIVRDGKDVSFTLAQDDVHTLAVRYSGSQPVPDTFKDGSEAIVEGQRQHDGSFEADHIQAKCASKYEAEYGKDAQHPTDVDMNGGEAKTDAASGDSY
ncbi:MAG TPA: cytochrome c maturation protein CcmE [Candidatus Krumholzibacteria bacterium]|nr:cytochrome c maturation protein CcmE [Candidatus Krumholzibacteria bacterium]